MKKYIFIVELFYFVYTIIKNVHLNTFKYNYELGHLFLEEVVELALVHIRGAYPNRYLRLGKLQ